MTAPHLIEDARRHLVRWKKYKKHAILWLPDLLPQVEAQIALCETIEMSRVNDDAAHRVLAESLIQADAVTEQMLKHVRESTPYEFLPGTTEAKCAELLRGYVPILMAYIQEKAPGFGSLEFALSSILAWNKAPTWRGFLNVSDEVSWALEHMRRSEEARV